MNIYFVGAGGIGMAALIRYYLSKGTKVAGYDKTPSALTNDLIAEGAQITYIDDVNEIPEEFKKDTLVVYTPAVPADNAILSFFRNNNFEVIKRAQLLGKITHDSKGLCFSGTHSRQNNHFQHGCPHYAVVRNWLQRLPRRYS